MYVFPKGLSSHAQSSSLYLQRNSRDKIPKAVYMKVGQVKVDPLLFHVAYAIIIESVDSISMDERDAP